MSNHGHVRWYICPFSCQMYTEVYLLFWCTCHGSSWKCWHPCKTNCARTLCLSTCKSLFQALHPGLRNYIPSSNLLFCGYEVIMVYLWWSSHVLLVDIIPWINKASLVLYIVCTLRAMPRPTWRSEAVWRCRVHLLWLKHWNLSLSRLIVSLRLHLCDWGASIDVACRLCMHYIDVSYTMRIMQLLGMWWSFHNYYKHKISVRLKLLNIFCSHASDAVLHSQISWWAHMCGWHWGSCQALIIETRVWIVCVWRQTSFKGE